MNCNAIILCITSLILMTMSKNSTVSQKVLQDWYRMQERQELYSCLLFPHRHTQTNTHTLWEFPQYFTFFSVTLYLTNCLFPRFEYWRSYQGIYLCLSCEKLLTPPPPLVLEGVDVEVDGAAEGGEEVADAGGVINPARPGDVEFLKVNNW